MPAPRMTRDEMVRLEGARAQQRERNRKDNPYRPGSADWRSWNEGFGR